MIKRPFFKYAGSKWILSKHYPAPLHDLILEPFAGSACYATRHHEREIVLGENSPEIAALWRYLITVNGNEIARLPCAELQEGQDIRELPISDGAKLLIRQWQRVGMSSCWTVSKWGMLPGQWNRATQDHVAASVEKIRHWRIFEGDYRIFPEQRGTWFIDPPYFGLPLYGSRFINYAELATWCQSRPGQVVVCEQSTARWLPFEPFRKVVTGRRGQDCSKGDSCEGLWTCDGSTP